MKRLLIFSLLVNLILVAGLAYMTHRLGGWKYAIYRLRNSEAGVYTHRKSLFNLLPVHPGAVVMLGDSETSLCEWQELLGDSTTVLNRGISGDYMDGIRGRLDEVLRAVAVAQAQVTGAQAQKSANADQGTDIVQAQAQLAR